MTPQGGAKFGDPLSVLSIIFLMTIEPLRELSRQHEERSIWIIDTTSFSTELYIFCRRLDIAFRNTKGVEATRTRTNLLGWIWCEGQPEQFILAQRYYQDERIRLAKMLDQSARTKHSVNFSEIEDHCCVYGTGK